MIMMGRMKMVIIIMIKITFCWAYATFQASTEGLHTLSPIYTARYSNPNSTYKKTVAQRS